MLPGVAALSEGRHWYDLGVGVSLAFPRTHHSKMLLCFQLKSLEVGTRTPVLLGLFKPEAGCRAFWVNLPGRQWLSSLIKAAGARKCWNVLGSCLWFFGDVAKLLSTISITSLLESGDVDASFLFWAASYASSRLANASQAMYKAFTSRILTGPGACDQGDVAAAMRPGTFLRGHS